MGRMTREEDVRFFATPEAWRSWLERNHADRAEVWVGFHKRGTGNKSITWPEAVDEALCYGWIDGIRKSIDDAAYRVRFTPRKSASTWSAVNVARVTDLTNAGRMTEAGLAAFGERREDKTGIYGHERRTPATLEPAWQARFEKNKKAWGFFQSQAPWYQRISYHWVMSAKKEETRLRRFEQLLDASANERRLGPVEDTRGGGTKKPVAPKKPVVSKRPRVEEKPAVATKVAAKKVAAKKPAAKKPAVGVAGGKTPTRARAVAGAKRALGRAKKR